MIRRVACTGGIRGKEVIADYIVEALAGDQGKTTIVAAVVAIAIIIVTAEEVVEARVALGVTEARAYLGHALC